MNENKLAVVDGETLMDMQLPKARFCVSTLLPQGLCILGGASKIGKSWFVLDLCLRVAKGEPVWNLPTEKGTALYLCLEDTLRRVQERLNLLTDDVPPNVFFATSAGSIADGLCEQIGDFVSIGRENDTGSRDKPVCARLCGENGKESSVSLFPRPCLGQA